MPTARAQQSQSLHSIKPKSNNLSHSFKVTARAHICNNSCGLAYIFYVFVLLKIFNIEQKRLLVFCPLTAY